MAASRGWMREENLKDQEVNKVEEIVGAVLDKFVWGRGGKSRAGDGNNEVARQPRISDATRSCRSPLQLLAVPVIILCRDATLKA